MSDEPYIDLRTYVTKEKPKKWLWEVKRGTELLKAGYCKTERDSKQDAFIAARMIEVDEARADGRIALNDEIKIKPEWMDKGDENYTFRAYETQLPGMDSIRMVAFHKKDGSRAIGNQLIYIDQIAK